jgi:hypothetical protein
MEIEQLSDKLSSFVTIEMETYDELLSSTTQPLAVVFSHNPASRCCLLVLSLSCF